MLTVLGEAIVDLVGEGDRRYRAHPGGSPLNVAVGLGRLGDAVLTLPDVLRTPAVNVYGRRAWETVDGRGADRVAEAVLELSLSERR